MSVQQGSFYKTGRAVHMLLEWIAWALVVLGVIFALTGFSTGGLVGMVSRDPPFLARLMAMAPGLGMGVVGIFLVAQVQSGRATLHSAEYAREMLLLMKEQSQAPVALASTAPALTAPVRAAVTSSGPAPEPAGSRSDPTIRTPPASPGGEARLTGMMSYKRQQVRYSTHNSIYVVGDQRFSSMDEAKAYIDKTFPTA